ncbi:MAG: glucoamylase family protein [Draconibacterium sp.]|nr:glucoamylase family protein [Draconibacterium sp.]
MKYFFLILLISIFLVACKSSTENEDNLNEKPALTDEQLLDTVQYYTFQYFWDGAEPNSGMARERYHIDNPQEDKNVVTCGGTGFGLMSILVGIERGFISRDEGLQRFQKIVNFLEKADRFHGVWPHWLNGQTGKVKPFSPHDDGGDIVETAFLVQGLLAVKQYFQNGSLEEKQLAEKIDKLWREVEWDWYQNKQNILYWHWSPNHGWKMNFGIKGYNECLIAYVLGASSPTHPIKPESYHEGWARSGEIIGNHEKFGYVFKLNHNGALETGGPLFWAHYSYLGLDPRNLSDKYTNYWNENVAQVKINRQHCVENPHSYKGYGNNCWGLTASYSVKGAAEFFEGKTTQKPFANSTEFGYAAHHPGFDLGVISPTAAISSLPYAPEDVLPVIRHFYKDFGDKLFGKFGFYDAFSEDYNWWPQRYLAIDQGPIVVMIENHRSALLWDLFMKDTDVQNGLNKLGFTY